MQTFESINRGYNSVFQSNQLSIGLVVPIENYTHSAVPTMQDHVHKVQLAEQLGFTSIWIRDVPFHVPSFGDAGQTYDPFTYLGFLTGQTSKIALGVASIALPLHHPVHVAKSAATIDQLSGGRVIMGVASGDRYDEYPAMGIDYESRGELFRNAFDYIRKAANSFPKHESQHFGNLKGNIELLPKPTASKIPMLITGHSRQSLEWNAEYGDGWMSYPKDLYQQKYTIDQWRELVAQKSQYDKPFMQPLYIDLQENEDHPPQAIHLGFRIGINYLVDYFRHLELIGVNHVALNLRFNSMDTEKTLALLAEKLLPHFDNKQTETLEK